jgi:hypothetical protein
MPISQARVATPLASRYLQQLCKHFAHKLPVEFDPQRGRIEFSIGQCRLQASSDLLTMVAEASDPETLAQLEGVVARHLERFAFREAPSVAWVPA